MWLKNQTGKAEKLPSYAKGNVCQYLQTSQMENDGIFANEVELYKAAALFFKNVYEKNGVH